MAHQSRLGKDSGRYPPTSEVWGERPSTLHQLTASCTPSSLTFAWECKYSCSLCLQLNHSGCHSSYPGSLSLDQKGRSAEVSCRCCCFPTSSTAWLCQFHGLRALLRGGCRSSCLPPGAMHIPWGLPPCKRHRTEACRNTRKGSLEPNRWRSTSVPPPCYSSHCSRRPLSPRKAGIQGRNQGINCWGWAWDASRHLVGWGAGYSPAKAAALHQHVASKILQISSEHKLPLVCTPQTIVISLSNTSWLIFFICKGSKLRYTAGVLKYFRNYPFGGLFSKFWDSLQPE